MAAVGFKPSALTVGTTVFPDGGASTADSYNLAAYGGSGAYTWSINSGSCSGLSITDATNGVYSGTPNVAGSCTVTFHVTDGTSSVNSNPLTWKIGSSLQTIATPRASTYSTSPNSASITNVPPNDALVNCYYGDDTHGTTSYLMQSANNSDSALNIYTRANPIVGGRSGAVQCFSAKNQQGGTITNQYSQGTYGGTPLAGAFMDFPGAQPIMDDMTVSSAAPGNVSSTTLTTSITTKVPNELVCSVATMNCGVGGGSSCTMSASTTTAGFNLLASVAGFAGTPFTVACQSEATAGSYSATASYSDSTNANMSADTIYQVMFALRPAVPPTITVLGEKKRRHGG